MILYYYIILYYIILYYIRLYYILLYYILYYYQSEGRNGLCKSLGAMMIQGYEVTKNLLLLCCCVVVVRAAWPSLMYRLNIHSKIWRSTF